MANLVFASIVPFLLAALPFGTSVATKRSCEQPYYNHGAYAVEGTYMVTFDSPSYTFQDHFNAIGETFTINQFTQGYWADLTNDQRDKVRTDCNVAFIEDDVDGTNPDNGDNQRKSVYRNLAARGWQKNAPWPLVQLSASVKNPISLVYAYTDKPGQGVDVYVMDSGINHPLDEFKDDEGNDRVTDFVNFSTEPYDWSDRALNGGHGTKVASAAAGLGYGVAKAANILNVKYEKNGVPNTSRFVQAMAAIIRRHNARKTKPGFKGSIINMSFSLQVGSKTATDKISDAYTAGISMVASAGNTYYNPTHFPSTNPHVLSIGARGSDYTPWREVGLGSNYGKGVVDYWAPGYKVPVQPKSGSSMPMFSTGTSIAAPYVSGMLAIFYGNEGTNMNPELAVTRVKDNSLEGWMTFPTDLIDDWKDSPNVCADTGYDHGQGLDPPRPYVGAPVVTS